MPDSRLEWLKVDLDWLFAYQLPLYFEGRFETLILSRRKIPDEARQDMFGDRRIKILEKAGIKTEILEVPSESTVIETLNDAARGVAEYHSW